MQKNDFERNILIAAITIITICVMGALLYHDETKRYESPKVLTKEETKNPDAVSKELKVSYPEAHTIVREIERADNSTPQITYYVQSPTVEKAAETTEAMIRKNDKSLPKAVTAKSDRTVVAPDTTAQKVDVYKISLRKAHKIKTGMTYIDDKAYLSAGYQAGRWEGLAHFNQNGFQGATVMYTLKEW